MKTKQQQNEDELWSRFCRVAIAGGYADERHLRAIARRSRMTVLARKVRQFSQLDQCKVIHNLYEAIAVFGDESDMPFRPRDPLHRTKCRPGTEEKITAMRERVERGEELHHPHDHGRKHRDITHVFQCEIWVDKKIDMVH